ncbi:MAG TPA: N-acetylmuramoyl-L-alanine amidase, partial [Pseudonocardiaceae bacterium]
MALPLVWMADVLRTAGVEVVEYPGWRERAASGAFAPRAVMWHHDASAAGPSPGMPRMIAEQGNAATPPPLAHAWVDT